MITLITGVPGAGKTALAVDMMGREGNGRLLYADGIPELSIPHEPAPPLKEWTHLEDDASSQDGKKLSFTFPPGSIVVVDEAQRIYRPRSVGKAVPDYVAAFETHRHSGVDFWLLTQHPGLLDANVRKLVTRHIHLRATALGRKLYEWKEIGDPDTKSSRDLAARRSYKLPRAVFSKYKSAELHTKVKARVPLYMWVCGLALLSLVCTLGYVYRTVSTKLAPSALITGTTAQATQTPQAAGALAAQVAQSPKGWMDAQVPRVDGLAHTAPAYDGIMKVGTAPFPAGCVSSPTSCSCFTAQATRLTMEDGMCRAIVAGGLYDPRGVEADRGGLVAGAGDQARAPQGSRSSSSSPAALEGKLPPAAVSSIPSDFKGTHIANGRLPFQTAQAAAAGVSVAAAPVGQP